AEAVGELKKQNQQCLSGQLQEGQHDDRRKSEISKNYNLTGLYRPVTGFFAERASADCAAHFGKFRKPDNPERHRDSNHAAQFEPDN
ncbi:MAG: hypothetical protein VYE69_09575, partial [Pseudomonadota bacterium]|nr:hypothetical protein [Pseudomonadota bacterium]